MADISPEKVEAMLALLRSETEAASRTETADMLEALAADREGWLSNAMVAREKWSEFEARATELDAMVAAYQDGTLPDLTTVYLAGSRDRRVTVREAAKVLLAWWNDLENGDPAELCVSKHIINTGLNERDIDTFEDLLRALTQENTDDRALKGAKG